MDGDRLVVGSRRGNETVSQRNPRRGCATKFESQIENGFVHGNDLAYGFTKVRHRLIRPRNRVRAIQIGCPNLEEREYRHAHDCVWVLEQGSHPLHPRLAEGTCECGRCVE